MLDIEMVKQFYAAYSSKISTVRETLKRPLTYAEKILFTHLYDEASLKPLKRGVDYADFRPNRVAMQDATAQMALLQFMNAGREHVAVPASVHCDHLIRADEGAKDDLGVACKENQEVYDFLRSASKKYGIGFWGPGAGIIHQVVLENYAFPGGMMIGTDSHTPNAGGLGMAAIGVGGADAVDVLTGQPWELRMPRIIGVHLHGQLQGWAAPKDVILTILGLLTTKGGTNAIMEYFGEGTKSLSTTGKATICNMGAELGATCSLFPYDDNADEYLCQTGREQVATMARQHAVDLRADADVELHPEMYYDQVIDLLHRWEPWSEVVILTGNGEAKYPQIEAYLREKNIKYKGINCDSSVAFGGRKTYGNVYLDDRGGLPSVYRMLLRLIDEIERGTVTHEKEL